MYKSKSIKKTIVVAAAAGMLITTSLGTVSASQLLNDSTVGVSSAFDKRRYSCRRQKNGRR